MNVNPLSQQFENLSALKVVLVHDKFPPNFAGGGEYVVLQIAKHLLELGCNVLVITAGDPDITEYDGIKTIRIPCSSYAFNFKWTQITALAKGADVIHGFTYHGLFPAKKAAKQLGVPFIKMALALFGEEWLNMKGPLVGQLFSWHERFLANLSCDKHIFISDFSHQNANRLGYKLDNSCIIEPGISLQDYAPASNKHYVMFAGKIDARKGVNVLLECAQNLPDIPFVIMGWGNNLLPQDIPSNVTFTQFEDRNQMAKLLAEAKIFVFPTRTETFGLAVAEAMASGCAIVSSSELPFAGEKIAIGDTDGFSDAINRLWSDTTRCEMMANENVKRAKQYTWYKHMQKTIEIYEELGLVKNSLVKSQ